ncbi:hypothetical protein GGR52DRAFT_578813 [Hypoxylon sp. FL1284]|nr:hypothetical protein GGR52DRAFT_578813 [Hypoxylon sp. FL1284]
MPSLSAAAARAINRNPLTPKIASKTTQKPPLLANTTPANQRTQHTVAVHSGDPSPFASHLSNNITPRSGSRQNRVDSANSTPNSTPHSERTEPWDPRSSFGLPSPRLEGEPMRRPAVSFGSATPDINSHGRQDAHHALDSKFFHASDAKPTRPNSASNKTASARNSTIFYANGSNLETKPSHPTPFTPALGHSQDNLPRKFLHANGTPEMRSSPTPPVSRSSGSGVSVAPKAPANRSGVSTPNSSHLHHQRPASPEKQPSQVPQASSKANIPASARQQALSNPQLGPSPPGLRRSSTGPLRAGGHSRQGSLARLEQVPHTPNVPKLASPQLSPEAPTPANVPSTPAPITLASIIQAAEDFAENEESLSPGDEVRSGLQSPTKSVHSVDPSSELVVNARRERKVQDLQIRNASLEAINKTLERQLRKQNAEVRRFRRMTRVGGLSLSSPTASSQLSSEALSEQAIGVMDLSDLSEVSEAEAKEEVEEDDESLDSDSASGSLSPGAMEERDAKHRKRDEARLQLDLSKHQQLLVDSQKINRSIKKCLDWTEELINEGKKALEYNVRVSDVELGGRVLNPLEEEDDDDEQRLASDEAPSDGMTTLTEKLLDSSAILEGWSFEPQDRDSGIELAVDGG